MARQEHRRLGTMRHSQLHHEVERVVPCASLALSRSSTGDPRRLGADGHHASLQLLRGVPLHGLPACYRHAHFGERASVLFRCTTVPSASRPVPVRVGHSTALISTARSLLMSVVVADVGVVVVAALVRRRAPRPVPSAARCSHPCSNNSNNNEHT